MNDQDLIDALRARGLENAANEVRDDSLAKRASEEGRDDVAELIKRKATRLAEPAQAKPRTAKQLHADRLVEALKRDTGLDLTRREDAA